jgi:hypothetical protein
MTPASKSGRRIFACRVANETPAIMDSIAKEFKCFRVDKDGQLAGACGVLMDKIARGELKIVSVA